MNGHLENQTQERQNGLPESSPVPDGYRIENGTIKDFVGSINSLSERLNKTIDGNEKISILQDMVHYFHYGHKVIVRELDHIQDRGAVK